MPSCPFSEWVQVMPDLNEFITIEEAAEKLKHHIKHVRRMIEKATAQV